MFEGPVVPAPPDPVVAQQELPEPVAGPGAVDDHVGPGPAQIPDRFLGHGRHPDGDQLPGPVQASQATAVTLIGLHPVARRGRDQRRRDHLTRHPQTLQQSSQLVAGRAGLVTRPQPARTAQAGHQPAHRVVVRGDLLHSRPRPGRAARSPPRSCSCATSRPRIVGLVELGMSGRLLPYVATSASWWLIHARCGTGRPFHTDWHGRPLRQEIQSVAQRSKPPVGNRCSAHPAWSSASPSMLPPRFAIRSCQVSNVGQGYVPPGRRLRSPSRRGLETLCSDDLGQVRALGLPRRTINANDPDSAQPSPPYQGFVG